MAEHRELVFSRFGYVCLALPSLGLNAVTVAGLLGDKCECLGFVPRNLKLPWFAFHGQEWK